MDEYIEREAVLARKHGGVVDVADIKNIPAADVAPVVKSEWEILTDDYGNERMRCKRCGEEFYDGDNDTVDTKHNFCPNCGARMEG